MSDKITKSNGQPFSGKSEAREVFIKKKLNPKEYIISSAKDGNGYVIVKKSVDIGPVTLSRHMLQVVQDEKFYFINISPPSNNNELRKIPITIRGATILCSRGIEICLPESYINVLRTAIVGVWENGVRYEEVRFPFSVIREGTKEDFEKCFR